MTPGVVQRAVAAAVRGLPRPVVARFARPYVAGRTLAEALAVADQLHAGGCSVTLDVLGEGYRTPDAVQALVDRYLEILRSRPAGAERPSLSVMMTGVGLLIDHRLCLENLRLLAGVAARHGRDLTINMEDSSTTTATLGAYRELRRDGHDNVGIVLQAALRRTLEDVDALAALAPRVRVVKGIWVEPYAVAYQDADAIRAAYVRIVERLFDAGSYVEVATHDEWLVSEIRSRIRERGIDRSRYEFQTLLGVRPELARLLLCDGERVRVYVPFGEEWYEYCMRRFTENPRVAETVLRASARQLASALRRGAGAR